MKPKKDPMVCSQYLVKIIWNSFAKRNGLELTAQEDPCPPQNGDKQWLTNLKQKKKKVFPAQGKGWHLTKMKIIILKEL